MVEKRASLLTIKSTQTHGQPLCDRSQRRALKHPFPEVCPAIVWQVFYVRFLYLSQKDPICMGISLKTAHCESNIDQFDEPPSKICHTSMREGPRRTERETCEKGREEPSARHARRAERATREKGGRQGPGGAARPTCTKRRRTWEGGPPPRLGTQQGWDPSTQNEANRRDRPFSRRRRQGARRRCRSS